MQELGYITFFICIWFVIPYVFGSWFFKRVKKKWRWLAGKKIGQRIIGFLVLLICALAGWLLGMLVLTGVKMML